MARERVTTWPCCPEMAAALSEDRVRRFTPTGTTFGFLKLYLPPKEKIDHTEPLNDCPYCGAGNLNTLWQKLDGEVIWSVPKPGRKAEV